MAKIHVLIVEDQQDGGEVIVDILKHFEITSDLATTAEAGLELFKHAQYSALLIDLSLPGMDGLTMIQTVRQLSVGKEVPAIALTAYHSSKVRVDALNAGFNAYITKPISYETLMDAMRQFLPEA